MLFPGHQDVVGDGGGILRSSIPDPTDSLDRFMTFLIEIVVAAGGVLTFFNRVGPRNVTDGRQQGSDEDRADESWDIHIF